MAQGKVAESWGIAAFLAQGVPDFGIMPLPPGSESIFRISDDVGLLSALEREPLLLAGFPCVHPSNSGFSSGIQVYFWTWRGKPPLHHAMHSDYRTLRPSPRITNGMRLSDHQDRRHSDMGITARLSHQGNSGTRLTPTI